ncbi:unnamed protein product [Xylocopa violacea]|uniref:Uncharacterized protein n=1 Tax=Xylocopa violacea TaxID=135666 RepID=A0ABP1PCE1_XYLVO
MARTHGRSYFDTRLRVVCTYSYYQDGQIQTPSSRCNEPKTSSLPPVLQPRSNVSNPTRITVRGHSPSMITAFPSSSSRWTFSNTIDLPSGFARMALGAVKAIARISTASSSGVVSDDARCRRCIPNGERKQTTGEKRNAQRGGEAKAVGPWPCVTGRDPEAGTKLLSC